MVAGVRFDGLLLAWFWRRGAGFWASIKVLPAALRAALSRFPLASATSAPDPWTRRRRHGWPTHQGAVRNAGVAPAPRRPGEPRQFRLPNPATAPRRAVGKSTPATRRSRAWVPRPPPQCQRHPARFRASALQCNLPNWSLWWRSIASRFALRRPRLFRCLSSAFAFFLENFLESTHRSNRPRAYTTLSVGTPHPKMIQVPPVRRDANFVKSCAAPAPSTKSLERSHASNSCSTVSMGSASSTKLGRCPSDPCKVWEVAFRPAGHIYGSYSRSVLAQHRKHDGEPITRK